jgi:hypothetical protein
MTDTLRLSLAALAACALYVAVYWAQNVPLAILQVALLGALVPFDVVNLVHGVRMVTAWMFGWWSVVVLLPATLFIYGLRIADGGLGSIPPSFHIVALVYLMSGPLALHVMGLVLPERHRSSRFEWRVLLMAGFLSAVVNSVVYGTLRMPYDPPSAGLVWFAGHVTSQILGLMVCLVALTLLLRWRNAGPGS